MKLTDTIIEILYASKMPLSPQEIRLIIKDQYPQFYGTSPHRINVNKGHYKDLDHALLAQIYSIVRNRKSFSCDTNTKPMKVLLINSDSLIRSNTKPKVPITREKNEQALISDLAHLYRESMLVAEDFGGPSVYFHIQSIKEQKQNFLSDRHIELIYATLASWGMHRMGDPNKTKAKMVDFLEFKNSILVHSEKLSKLSLLRMDTCSIEEYEAYIEDLKDIYFNLKVSISEATIVANSKVLAHILPHLVPPIDRQYTIRFFTQEYKNFFLRSGKPKSVSTPSRIDYQFEAFKDYCSRIKILLDKCDSRIFALNMNSFNTSYPKIMDNIIMAFVKDAGKQNKYKDYDLTK